MRSVAVVVEEIAEACASMEGLPYDGEPVDQLQHALQAGALARAAGADRETVIAALLHDIARAPAVAGVMRDVPHAHHGALGFGWLEPRVGERVARLAEQHVPAKRFLVATDPSYSDTLSPASRETLQGQGGPMTAGELAAFRADPDWEAAVRLRRWDDAAKVPGLEVPGFDSYRDELAAVVAVRLTRG